MRIASICILFLLLAGCSGSVKIASYTSDNHDVDSTFESNGLDSIIAPYRSDMEAQMNEEIGHSDTSLVKYNPESPLGNFVADVVYQYGRKFGESIKDIGPVDMQLSMCLLNFGGLRAPINEGAITVGNIYELMPFDNTICIVKINPDKMREMLIYLREKQGQPVSNAKMILAKSKQLIKIGGEDYNFDKDVYVITSDYLANGGDKMDFFKDPVRKWDSGILIRDALIEFVRESQELEPYLPEKRIEIAR